MHTSLHEMICHNTISLTTPIHGIPIQGLSVAARHTALRYEGIMLDCGLCSFEQTTYLLLITHGHLDHSRGYFELIGHGHIVTIICPYSIASNIFNAIKYQYSISKGRDYDDKEIAKLVRIIGVGRSDRSDELIELIEHHRQLVVQLKGNEKKVITSFPCHHTVECVGYQISDYRLKLLNTIELKSGMEFIVNLTEDQQNNNIQIFAEVERFKEKYKIEIECMVRPYELPNKHILYRRHLKILQNIQINTMNDGKCILDRDDMLFFKRYNIPIQREEIIPQVMFFGDTRNTIFKDRIIRQYMETTRVIIIESTFLENPDQLTPKQRKERQDKCHISFPELFPLFEKYKNTDFVLIHFSAQYKTEFIRETIRLVQDKYPNIMPLI